MVEGDGGGMVVMGDVSGVTYREIKSTPNVEVVKVNPKKELNQLC